jgi:hypothetical protein
MVHMEQDHGNLKIPGYFPKKFVRLISVQGADKTTRLLKITLHS